MQKSKIEWCLKKETRMKKIEPNSKLSKEHIDKAKHNLKAAKYNEEGNFEDWSISQTYYAMYHALLAILFKAGYESKNHECTIGTAELLIAKHNLTLTLKDIAIIRSTKQLTPKDAKSLREQFQYGTKTKANKELVTALIDKAKQFVEKAEVSLQEL